MPLILALFMLLAPAPARGINFCRWFQRAVASYVGSPAPAPLLGSDSHIREYTTAEHDLASGKFVIRSASTDGETTVIEFTPVFDPVGALSHYEYRSERTSAEGVLLEKREGRQKNVPTTTERIQKDNQWRTRSREEVEAYEERRRGQLEFFAELHGVSAKDIERCLEEVQRRRPDLELPLRVEIADALAILRGPKVVGTLAHVAGAYPTYRAEPARLREDLLTDRHVPVSLVGENNWRYTDLLSARQALLRYGFESHLARAVDAALPRN